MCCQALYLSEIGPCDVAMESRNILYEVLGMNQKGNDKKMRLAAEAAHFQIYQLIIRFGNPIRLIYFGSFNIDPMRMHCYSPFIFG